MPLWLPLLALMLWSTVSSAAPLPLPQGARWMVAAPSAGQFARDATALLVQAGKQSSAVSPHSIGTQLERSFGVPLAEEARLTAVGIDPLQPWLLFERGGATYLALSVRDPVALATFLDQWGSKRLLKREEEKLGDQLGTAVTFSRSAGARPVTGYLIARGRLVLLVTPGERSAGLGEAWKACEEAAPVIPPLNGTVLAWLGNDSPLRDGWLAFTARADGIDLKGVARKTEPGWVTREPGRVDWLRAITGQSDGLPGDAPARLRFSAGPKAATALTESIVASASVSEAMEKWIASLTSLGPGPVEATAQAVDVAAIQSGSSGDLRTDLLMVTHPQLQIVDRPAAAVAKRVEAAVSALCKPKKVNADVVTSTCFETPLTVARAKGSLSLTWGRSSSNFELPAPKVSASSLVCAAGMPVAAARLDLSAVFRGTQGIGFLDALSNDALAGLYAFVMQYGQLMKASRPAVALMCEDKDGKTTLEGVWRFATR